VTDRISSKQNKKQNKKTKKTKLTNPASSKVLVWIGFIGL